MTRRFSSPHESRGPVPAQGRPGRQPECTEGVRRGDEQDGVEPAETVGKGDGRAVGLLDAGQRHQRGAPGAVTGPLGLKRLGFHQFRVRLGVGDQFVPDHLEVDSLADQQLIGIGRVSRQAAQGGEIGVARREIAVVGLGRPPGQGEGQVLLVPLRGLAGAVGAQYESAQGSVMRAGE